MHPTPSFPKNILQKIPLQSLKQYLRICLFGTMQTNSSLPTSQQQQHLFNILQQLHHYHQIDIKGCWSIISLAFNNRSGLVLMAIFNNYTYKICQFIHKKNFIKDLQILENPNLTLSTLSKLLQIINITQLHFYQKYKYWQQQMSNAETICNNTPIIFLNQNKIYQQDQYDSQPDTNHYIHLHQLHQQQTQLRRFSLPIPPLHPTLSQQTQNSTTITISNLKRKIEQPYQKIKIKKTKRPNYNNKKIKLFNQINNKSMDLIKFINNNKIKSNLIGTYHMIQSMRNNSTPKKSHLQINTHQYHPPKYTTAFNKKYKNTNQMDIQQIIPYSFNQTSNFVDDDHSSIQIKTRKTQNRYSIVDSDQDNCTSQKQRKGRLKKKQNKYQHKLFQQLECIENEQNSINEKAQNLQIKKIKFPSSYSQLVNLNLLEQSDHCYFNLQAWNQCLKAMTEKEKWNKLKYFIMKKDNLDFQNIYTLLSLISNNQINLFLKGYIIPLLKHKLIKLLSNITNQVINILYTSLDNYDKIPLTKSCKFFIITIHTTLTHHLATLTNLTDLIMATLTDILQDISTKNLITDTLINLPRPLDIIKQTMKIKLTQNDLKQTILITLYLITHEFIKPLLQITNYSQYLSTFHQEIAKAYSIIITNKPRFLKHISDLYLIFQIPLTKKQQYESIVSLMKQINLTQPQPPYLSHIISQLTRSFILNKSIQDPQFNYKPMLNYILKNQFIQQSKTIPSQLSSQILLNIYSVILTFKQFHHEMTIRQIIYFINKNIDYAQKHNQSFYITILNLLFKCYTIKLTSKHLTFLHDITPQNQIQRLFLHICKSYQTFSKITSKQSTQKLNKFQNILSIFINQFVNDQQIHYQTPHYLFCLKIILNSMTSFLTTQQKQSQFLRILSQTFLTKIHQLPHLYTTIRQQIINQPTSIINIDQFQQTQILFNRKQQLDQSIKYLSHQIKIIIYNAHDQFPKSYLYLNQMKLYHHQNYFKIQGIFAALYLLHPQTNPKLLQSTFKQLQYHSKQLKILKPQNLFKWTNKMVLQFLQQFFKSLLIFISYLDPSLSKKLDQIGSTFKDTIFDIIFLGFICAKDRQQIKQIIMLLEDILHFKCFNQFQHLLNQFPITICDRLQIIYPFLSTYYNMIVDIKNKNKIVIKNSFIYKFKTPYFEALYSLYKQYEQYQWNIQRTHLGINILTTFIFLMKIDTNQDILKTYRAHFIMTNSQIPKDKFSYCNNILRFLDLSNQYNCYTAKIVIELFRVAHDKKIISLGKTRQFYLQYIVNLTLVNSGQSNTSTQFKFTKIKALIQALHDEYPSDQPTYQNQITTINNFSIPFCCNLLSNLFSKCYLLDNIKNNFVIFFFSLFKSYPLLNSAFIIILKNGCQKIDKIIKSKRCIQLNSCETLQDAIKKYVLHRKTNFQQLYLTLQSRTTTNLQKSKTDLTQLKQIIITCIKFIQDINRQNNQHSNQILFKYTTLLTNIQNNQQLRKNQFIFQPMLYHAQQFGNQQFNQQIINNSSFGKQWWHVGQD